MVPLKRTMPWCSDVQLHLRGTAPTFWSFAQWNWDVYLFFSPRDSKQCQIMSWIHHRNKWLAVYNFLQLNSKFWKHKLELPHRSEICVLSLILSFPEPRDKHRSTTLHHLHLWARVGSDCTFNIWMSGQCSHKCWFMRPTLTVSALQASPSHNWVTWWETNGSVEQRAS